MPVGMRELLIPTLSLTSSSLVQRQRPSIMWGIFYDLSAVLPAEFDIANLLREIVGPDCSRGTVEFLKLAIYILSNKLLHKMSDAIFRLNDALLQWFKMGNNVQFLKAILSDRTPTIDAFAEGIFARALDAEDQTMSRIFLQSGMNPNIRITTRTMTTRWNYHSYTPLEFMVQRSNINMIKLLFEFNAHIHNRTRPLHIAAEIGEVEIGRLLICQGAKINITTGVDVSALQRAAGAGNNGFVKMLLEEGADVNHLGGSDFGKFRLYGCPLECAIRSGTDTIAEMLLERGANIEARQPSSNTPLQSAVKMGNEIMTQRLLELGADVNAARSDHGGRTALQHAAEHGDLQLCQTLIGAGANVNVPLVEYHGVTALMAAVSSQNPQLVTFLLEAGAEVKAVATRREWEDDKTTALEYATSLDNLEIVHILLSAGADASCDNSILFAVRAKRPGLITTLLTAGANIRHNRIIDAAVTTGDCKFVRFLLAQGAQPGPQSFPHAAESGSYEMCDLLIAAGADLNAAGGNSEGTALEFATLKGNMDLLKYLLRKGADVNSQYALVYAVQFGNMAIVQLLIDLGADVNRSSSDLNGVDTLLQRAVSRNNVPLIRFLLHVGADINAPASEAEGRTALQFAAANGADNIVDLLLRRGADVNAPACSVYGVTALQAASVNGHYQTVELLLAKGADVEALASAGGGITALQGAAGGGYLRIAKLLLDRGADVNGRTQDLDCCRSGAEPAKLCIICNISPLICAAQEGRIDMLKMLLNAGAIITGDGGWQLEFALKRATFNGHDAAAKFLEAHQIC